MRRERRPHAVGKTHSGGGRTENECTDHLREGWEGQWVLGTKSVQSKISSVAGSDRYRRGGTKRHDRPLWLFVLGMGGDIECHY